MSETSTEGGQQSGTGGTGGSEGGQQQQTNQQGGQQQTSTGQTGQQGTATEAGRLVEQQRQQQAGQQSGTEGGIESLPEWAQKLIRDTRSEAASARTSAKETAAKEARDALLAEIGKALGKEDKPDPEKLKADLESSSAKHRGALVELAVVRAAGKAGADVDALLDSRAFVARLDKLDPSADDFATKVTEEIAAAVRDNPKLSAGQPATRSGGQVQGGAGDSGGEESWESMEKRARAGRTSLFG